MADSTITNDLNKQVQNGTIKPVSKEKVGVWNFISWGGTVSVESTDKLPGNDNANGAVKVARSMYQGNFDTTVKSTLCYGVQWDTMLQFIDPNYTGYAKDSIGKGNDTGKIMVTGNDINYAQKNVFDMQGNLFEWTMEGHGTSYRLARGGDYNGNSSMHPASIRGDVYPSDYNSRVGFRVTLYL